jgi:hypothetical protein
MKISKFNLILIVFQLLNSTRQSNLLNIIRNLDNRLNVYLLLMQKPMSSYLFYLNYFLIILLKNKINKNIFLNIINYNKDVITFLVIFRKIKNSFKKVIILRRLKITLKELS